MIKLRDIINEAKWSDRKWGDPLPTLEDVMKEADDDDAYVHVGGGTYKEKNRATGKPLPNSPSYIKKDSGGYEMVDDDDPRLSKDDDDKGDEEKPSGGDLDYSRDGEESDDEEGEPDFYDPEDYEKHYPEKTKPKDEVGGVKYGQGFSADSDHMFDSVADSKRFTYDDEHSSTPSEDKYSGMLDAVKGGDWEKFRAGIHDIEDQDAREHLLNLANHVDSGTYKGEFPSGKKGVKFGRKEVMDLFKQAADYGHEQGSGDDEEKPSGEPEGDEEGVEKIELPYYGLDRSPADEKAEEFATKYWEQLKRMEGKISDERYEDMFNELQDLQNMISRKLQRPKDTDVDDDFEHALKGMKSDSKKLFAKLIKQYNSITVKQNESIKVINGKKYKAIKEAKKFTLLQESKMEIRKMWDRIRIKEDYMTEADDDKEKKHDKGDVWKSEKTGNWQAIGPSGDQESFGKDKEAAEKHANPEEKGGDKGGDEKEPAGKLGGGDFERPDTSEPEDKPFGGDTGTDADYGGGDFTKSADYDMWSDDEPSGEEPSGDEEEKPKFAGPVPTDKELDKLSKDELETEHENTSDEMEELESYIEMAKEDLEMAEDEEDREQAKEQIKQMEKEKYSLNIKSSRLAKKIKGDSDKKPSGGTIGSLGHRGRMDRTGTEEIKIINGKKYKAIKESKKPTLLYESKMKIRKMWNRIK